MSKTKCIECYHLEIYCRYFSNIGNNSLSLCSKISAWQGLVTIPIFLVKTGGGKRSISFGKLMLNLRLFWSGLEISLGSDFSLSSSSCPLYSLICCKRFVWLWLSILTFNFDSWGGTDRSDIKRCGQLNDLCRRNRFAEKDCRWSLFKRLFPSQLNVFPNTLYKKIFYEFTCKNWKWVKKYCR